MSSNGKAPWDGVPATDQLFVMITGANSGIGLGTCHRLIDEYLATRSLTSHICLIPTTRSASKSAELVEQLREYVENVAKTSDSLKARAGSDYDWKDTVSRVHILSMALDLCDLRSLYELGDRISFGTLSNSGKFETDYLQNVHLPRLDAIICNAGYGGWTGLSWVGLTISMLTLGFMESITYPNYKTPEPTRILNEDPSFDLPDKPLLAEVFCANIMGHYILGHRLTPAMSRSKTDKVPPGRLIWTSSVEAHKPMFDFADMQSMVKPTAYESAKRLTDILSLTCTTPAAQKYSSEYLSSADLEAEREPEKRRTRAKKEKEIKEAIPPKMYLSHPGVVASTLFPLPWFLFWAYRMVVYMGKLFGSPWHLRDAYAGSKAATWIVLSGQEELDSVDAQRKKWGSASDITNIALSKETEVEDWGFNGKAEPVTGSKKEGSLSKLSGRRYGATDATEEQIAEFERLGADCWKEMERMRKEWNAIIEEELD